MEHIILTGDASEMDYPLVERYLNQLTGTAVFFNVGLTSSMQGLVRLYCQRNGRFVRPLWTHSRQDDIPALASQIRQENLPIVHFFHGEDNDCITLHRYLVGVSSGYFPVLI